MSRALVSMLALGAVLLAAVLPAADLPILEPGRLHEVRLDLDPADWQALRDSFLTDQYHAADVRLDGELLAQTGIRSRGDSSRSGSKPGLKLHFDKYVAGQAYHGTKTLVLDNLVTDPSMLREHLAFQVFEAMGLPAPATSFARLLVNGEPWGVYGVAEVVNKPFLRARLGDDEGYLYDYEWAFPYRFGDLGAPSQYVPVPFQPATHEDDPDASGLVELVRAVNGSPDADFLNELSRFLEPQRLIDYLAVENALAERDGLLGEQGVNNFYLYQHAGSERFTFIPWDKDTSFTSDAWPLEQRLAENVLSRRLLEQPGMLAAYQAAVLRCVQQFVNPSWLGPRLQAAYQLIRAEALLDQHKPFSNDAFEQAVDGLEGVVALRAADVAAQLPR
jgi:spore coat protein CotH